MFKSNSIHFSQAKFLMFNNNIQIILMNIVCVLNEYNASSLLRHRKTYKYLLVKCWIYYLKVN